MFLLKKIFNLRDKSSEVEVEKPFLEHLEDLRVVITKVVLTLLISTIACYVFRNTMMDVLRRPIEKVWQTSQQEKLPAAITPDLWEIAKNASHYATSLTPEERDAYFAQFDNPKLRYYALCAGYYRAASSIKDVEKRTAFIDQLPNVPDDVKNTTKELLAKGPTAQLDAKNNVVYMRSLKPTETFMLSIKLAFFAGIIVAFPLVLYFSLQFILPGLKKNEKRALWPAMIIGFGLFLGGILFCYFVVLPKTLDFFYTYSGSMGVENEWRIGDYITFATQFTLIFGLSFELPVVVMTMVKLGLLSYTSMSNTRSYAIITIFLVGAIITPTGDALTLFLLSGPMCILYEICIWLAYFSRKKELEQEAAEEAAAYERQMARMVAPAGALTAAHEDDEHDQHDVHDDYHEHEHNYHNYDADYFHSPTHQQTDTEGEEIDDGHIHHYHDEHDGEKAFGHEADVIDHYEADELDSHLEKGHEHGESPADDEDLPKPDKPH